MTKPYLVLGGGGHARVIIGILVTHNTPIQAVVAPDLGRTQEFKGLKHLRKDDEVRHYNVNEVTLVNALGSLPGQYNLREELFKRFKKAGYQFLTVVSETAIISQYAVLQEGVQVLPGAVLNACNVGENSIVNTGAIVEHDVTIGKHCHIAPGATICGNVTLGNNVHIGAGAIVIQGVDIGDSAVVGAGSVVSKNLSARDMHYPAKSFIKKGSQ
ncbi:acetyltransferase [Idiomarina loihiensis]|uniref:acetyltransferase n=1 Tax=Idiomarina loihiensis TaxID=135577 RepID=UPI00129CBFC9|nr:acetyltransferase [Idiomarina loihiensis]MRJ45162.1 acetyltransferase [Idiomarina loihiensis]UTW32135.1 acetyltransferase [Idiomarina loihiensis]